MNNTHLMMINRPNMKRVSQNTQLRFQNTKVLRFQFSELATTLKFKKTKTFYLIKVTKKHKSEPN